MYSRHHPRVGVWLEKCLGGCFDLLGSGKKLGVFSPSGCCRKQQKYQLMVETEALLVTVKVTAWQQRGTRQSETNGQVTYGEPTDSCSCFNVVRIVSFYPDDISLSSRDVSDCQQSCTLVTKYR